MIRKILENWTKIPFLLLYYGLCRWLPASMFPFFGGMFKSMRYFCCKHIFEYCGKNVNVERGALFGSGFRVRIGDKSGIGVNCVIPSNTVIGNNVNMGPEVYILGRNHRFDRTDITIQAQGYCEDKQTIIGNDVWIGREVTFTPGRIVKDGTIIGACCLLCKDFPEYSIVGGNPSKLIRIRK